MFCLKSTTLSLFLQIGFLHHTALNNGNKFESDNSCVPILGNSYQKQGLLKASVAFRLAVPPPPPLIVLENLKLLSQTALFLDLGAFRKKGSRDMKCTSLELYAAIMICVLRHVC